MEVATVASRWRSTTEVVSCGGLVMTMDGWRTGLDSSEMAGELKLRQDLGECERGEELGELGRQKMNF
ncbi:hypothetical protein GBA52_018125 [Prunus armeniaca]|nr:hypothetical protein GBA52_018125 [Prunus armeniaca]